MRGDVRLRAACGLLLMSMAIITKAGPVDRASRFQALRLGNDQQSAEVSESQIGVFPQNMTITGNETISCTVGDNEYTIGETFAGNSLCERCSCAQTGVICSQVQCEVRAGCKALHKADLCCPQYQCECERNGKLYSNGEKLVDPKNPCQVCYCQGGEIVCNKIACFRRDDCQPRYVSDRCCPEYDHCPPRDMEMENHIHSKDSTLKPENEKFEAVSEYTEGYKPTTDSVVVKSGDSLTSENNREEVGGILRNGDYLPNIDRSSLPLNINEEAVAKKALMKTAEQGQTINIKEVTQDKSFNNEIRIKEVLPISSFEISSYSTKSPTIPREVSYNDESSKESEESSEKLYKAEKNVQSHDITSNNEAFPTPPILRIGDQLLFLKLGDLVPENGTLSTPSSVFTVIGAEGLQRVEDDSEEMFEHKEDVKKNDSPNALLITVIKDESNLTKEVMSQTEKKLNEAFLNLTENDNNLRTIILSEDMNETTTENPDKILQEVIFQLYATTTITPQTDVSDSKSEEEKDDLLFNTINQTKVSESFSDSTEITYKEHDQTTDDPSVFADKSNADQPLDDEQQPIPIEHLPEHNPEYPPILEDIMVLPMTEDSLESEFSGGSAIDSHESKYEEKSTPVKRPALFDSTIENKNNNIQKHFSPVKILPDVLESVRTNKTKDTTIPLVPEEWLKSTEGSQPKHVELNSPLLALSSAIPDIILQTELKDSSEEDETKIYIFVNNDTLNSNSNIVNLSQPEEITTDETVIQTTESIELEAEYRSPGEPHLVPEWERNLTTTEIPEDSSENFETEQTEDPLFIMTTFVENSNRAERVNDNSAHPIEMNTTPNDEHSSNEITPFLEYSTEYVKPSRESMYRSPSPFVESQMENQKESSLERSHEAVTHPVTTTEHSIQAEDVTNTENKAIFHSDSEVVQNFDLLNIGAHTKKQKKTSSLLAAEIKNDNSNDLTKKGNILADLIKLVGDVAAMGTHDIEISTVSNRIDVPKLAENHMKKDKIKMQQIITQKPLSTTAKIVTSPVIVEEYVTVEFSEFTPPNDKIDVETPSENEKVEMTTRKTYIDKDGDDRNNWKSTDYIVKDIEIIPKVGNNLIKKNYSHERIFTNDDTRNDIASTTEYKNVATNLPVTTITPRNLIIKEKIQKVLADGRKNIVTETKTHYKTGAIDISTMAHMPSIPEVEEKTVVAKEVLMKNDAIDLSISPLKKELTTLQPTVDFVEKTEDDKAIENNGVTFTQLNEMVTNAQMTTKSPLSIQIKEDKRTNVDESFRSSEESFKNVINKVVNKVPITTLHPISNEKYGSAPSDTNINSDIKSNTQLRKVITNLLETTQAPSVSRERIMTDTSNEKTNMQFKKLVTVAPSTIEEKQNPIIEDKPKVDTDKKEDVIIYTTVKTSTSSPTIVDTKTSTEAIKQKSQGIAAMEAASVPVVKNETVISENSQQSDAERAATESPGVTSTVMKVSSRTQNDDGSQENASTENGRDKLTKRETNSQLTDASGQINESLISIMRDFFEKQYRH